MSEQPRRPMGRRLQANVMRIVSVSMRMVLGLPVATPLGKRPMLDFIVEPKSGETYHQPVSYVRDGSTLLTPGGGIEVEPSTAVCNPVRSRVPSGFFGMRTNEPALGSPSGLRKAAIDLVDVADQLRTSEAVVSSNSKSN